MAHPINPPHGARFQIEKQSQTQEAAIYQVEIRFAESTYTQIVTVKIDEKPPQLDKENSEFDTTLPTWVLKYVHSYLRQCSQQAKKKGTWPRRIRRWHENKNPPAPRSMDIKS